MSISNTIISNIKAKVSIVDVISKYVDLKRSGGSPWLMGKCPFHEETEHSFKVNESTQSWFCYGCGKGSKDDDNKGSDVFAFVQEIEEVDFPEACRILAESVGIEIVFTPPDPEIERLKLISHNHNLRYYKQLHSIDNSDSTDALKYLLDRGLNIDTIKEFRLGLVPSNEIQNRNDSLDIANRIAIPIVEIKAKDAKTIGMSYRHYKIDTDKKYKNDHNTKAFIKGDNLFGLNNAISSIRHKKYGIIVEGYFDVMQMHQAGVKNSVSCMGNMITENQLLLMKRYARTWIVLFDGDKGGRDGIERVLPMALKIGLNIKVAMLPDGEDPDTFIFRLGAGKFDKWLSNNTDSLLEVIVQETLNKYENSVMELKKQALARLNKPLSSLSGTDALVLSNLINNRLNIG